MESPAGILRSLSPRSLAGSTPDRVRRSGVLASAGSGKTNAKRQRPGVYGLKAER
ncbi:hypothetical protein RSSM_05008 [Rhodopirellula sallentina SM41]|uniref:Uncharacterized protein n=1 Tax=Rhodopirellula sallentina SM41 TaxID=1263870 RepID=M5TWG5_9BACT|nr:hypothetical protein RSSM_05008 [Rhodopirellula sallentina SM41]